MGLRDFLSELEEDSLLTKVNSQKDPYLEIAGVLRENPTQPHLFEDVKGSAYKVAAGVCANRSLFAKALGCEREELLSRITQAIKHPLKPERVSEAPCKDVVVGDPDLSELPVLTHSSRDMGPYITAGVWVSYDKKWGLNADYHRACPISENELVVRVCQRDMHRYLKENDPLPCAICIGLHPSVSLAASVSQTPGTDELAIANSLKPLELVRCESMDVWVPSEAEIVVEGTLTASKRHSEGPFPDITRTYDKVRDEPVFTVNCVTHRRNPIYQALLPAYSEHFLLMGMPREPTIFEEVSRVVDCRNVLLTEGGSSWLHAVVQIAKKQPEDGLKAVEAAFKGHASLKHCVVVDEDIDPYDPHDVEWAVATRCQFDENARVWRDRGSSLDCSAEPAGDTDRLTTAKLALDATIPWDKGRRNFVKAELGV
ncbi:MAG: UbiD family decarboxylase [Candidatus Altiarchaeales archaeon]|nr:UbiD family decarboxylase [Candidatus Altiarchaeales archaeon]